MFKLFSKFWNSDIREKFYKIEKIVGFKIYPTYFYKKGIRSFYSNLILSFLLLGKSKNTKKFIFQEIINYSDQKKNILLSLPRSGSMAVRLMLNSYFELLFKVGNGVPEYDSLNHKWNFKVRNIFSAALQNNLDLKNLSFDYRNYLDKENYDLHKIFFSRFPITKVNILKLEKSKKVLIIREPNDQILSYYSNHKLRYVLKYSSSDKDNYNDSINLIKKAYENYMDFTNYWYNYFKNKNHKENFLIINFKNLQENPSEVLTEIINFYGIKLTSSYVEISASMHTKQNTNERLKNFEIKKSRFTEIEKKKKFQQEVNSFLATLNKDKLLEANYKKIIGLKL